MQVAECRLLSELGARPGGRVHVVVTDLREELVAYVNGSPYLRRELEMPSAALHHAGQWPFPPPLPHTLHALQMNWPTVRCKFCRPALFQKLLRLRPYPAVWHRLRRPP